MALVIKSRRNGGHKSALGALFISNPKKRRKNPARKKRRNPVQKRKNALALKRRKNAAHKKAAVTRKKNALALKRKKNALALKRRKNALALKRRKNTIKRRRNGTHKGAVRKSARRAYMKKNSAYMKRRKNGTRKGMRRKTARLAYLRNPDVGIQAIKPLQKGMKKIPLLKQVAPYVGAITIGALAVLPYNYLYGHVSTYLQRSDMPQWVKKTDKYMGLALVGGGIAALTNYGLKATKLVNSKTANWLSISMAIMAGGAQMIRLKELFDAGELKLPFLSKKSVTTTASSNGGAGATGALAYYGDGMAYDVVPMYGEAMPADATVAGQDISAQEQAVSKMGMSAWMRSFGECPYKSSSHDGTSRYAGKHGHRWGWLIKTLGWTRFAQLCQLSTPQRIKAISRIKIAAINASQSAFDQGAKTGYSGLALDMGALAYDPSMSGLAMIGASH